MEKSLFDTGFLFAVFDEDEPFAVKIGQKRNVEPAVTVNERRRRAAGAGFADHEIRDLGAVLRGRVALAHLDRSRVDGGIDLGEDLERLAVRGAVDAGRCAERAVAEEHLVPV